MSFAAAVFLIVGFTVLLRATGLVDKAREVVAIGRQAATTIRDNSLDDLEKERQMQKASLRLFGLLAFLVLGTITAITLPLLMVWLAELAGLVSLHDVLALFLRWDFVLASTILGISVYLALAKLQK